MYTRSADMDVSSEHTQGQLGEKLNESK
jgi:hypothetical protein